METENDSPDTDPAPAWQPLPRSPRRILGVLVEKAKTTPDSYPLSLNALTNGCNQKSNRDPVMNLSPDAVEESLDWLREVGAVAEVHGGGRVPKYRHYMKDWLGVDGTQLAVVAELLLRGTQTVGDLRGRAARMASGQLPDVNTLRPILAALIEKKLVVPLTPEGRGQLVTHGLYPPEEMAAIEAKYGGGVPAASDTAGPRIASNDRGSPVPVTETIPPSASVAPAAPGAPSPAASRNDWDALHSEIGALRAEVARMKKEIEDIWSNLG